MALRLAYRRPDLVRGVLSIDGGPAETPATPGLRRSLRFGGFLTKLVVGKGMLRGKVRKELVAIPGTRRGSPRPWWTHTPRAQAADVDGTIDGLRRMSKAVEPESLKERMRETRVPVRLVLGAAPHASAVKDHEIALRRRSLPTSTSRRCRAPASTCMRSSRGRGGRLHPGLPETTSAMR